MAKKQNKKIYILIFIIRVISIITIIISSYYIYNWYSENENTNKILDEIWDNAEISTEEVDVDENTQTNLLNVDFNKLNEMNSDTVGWIKVLGTDINYPVVQTTDNSFYLTHSFDKSYNKAGWIFADYTNLNITSNQLDKNTVVYGHNRQNSTMFGTLSNTLKQEWQSNVSNRYINFSTANKNMLWEVFSTYTIDSENYYIKTQFSSDKEFKDFIKTIKNRSNYNFNIDVSNDDKILTLSTCTNIGKGRTVLHAKLIN